MEEITDCLAIENHQLLRGVYHILGGVLNPLLGVGPKELELDKLAKNHCQNITEVILALNPSVEGCNIFLY